MGYRYKYNNSKYKKRGIVSLISYFIRQLYLPNPFANLFKNSNMAVIINLICGFIFIPLSYSLTHSFYNGGSKEKGAFGFLINYCLLTGVFLLITKFITNLYFVAIIFILVYVILYIIENKIFEEKYFF